MRSTLDFLQMKKNEEKITMITAYDYPAAKQVEAADADMILVGDSLGMVVLGYDSTTQVTLEDMIHHGKAARRGAEDTFIVIDMPFMSYHASLEKALENATSLFTNTRAQAVKVEGSHPELLELVRHLTQGGIPVVAHIGLTPQTHNVLGGFKVQGNSSGQAEELIQAAKSLEESGAFMIVLECIPKELAALIDASIQIPTIGIGAGIDVSGQVLVYHDILKYGVDRFPKFVKNYGDFNEVGVNGLRQYVTEVKRKAFPTEPFTYTMKNKENLPNK